MPQPPVVSGPAGHGGIRHLLLLLAGRNGGETHRPADATVRVISFDARYGTAKDGANERDKRLGICFEKIRNFRPDLIGFLEVLALKCGDRAADERLRVLWSRPEDGVRKGQMSLIGCRKDQIGLLQAGAFWLSETPDVPSEWRDSAQMRNCSWVRLHEKAVDRDLLFANTHFDHRGVVARGEASRMALGKLTLPDADRLAFLAGHAGGCRRPLGGFRVHFEHLHFRRGRRSCDGRRLRLRFAVSSGRRKGRRAVRVQGR
ncbi:MAG: hypothetical protein HYZ36_04990 [Pedosphaera parvula]|nr:hypothetical protein [Pedosphaera parvula]